MSFMQHYTCNEIADSLTTTKQTFVILEYRYIENPTKSLI